MRKFWIRLPICLCLCLTACMPEVRRPGGEIEDFIPSASMPQTASSGAAESSAESHVTELRLAYNANDSLNPYQMTTSTNLQLVPLFYDSLTRPDHSHKPELQLAEQVTMEDEGRMCVVTWREDARFSDGSYLTGDDIVDSFRAAMTAASPWRSSLLNVTSIIPDPDRNQATVRLYAPDADFPLLLSFPIIKSGTADAEYPTGVSKFYVTGAHNTGVILSRNEIYYGKKTSVGTVRLIHSVGREVQQFRLSSGEIDMMFTDATDTSLAGASGPGYQAALNNLVYLGINGNRGLLSRPEFRHALSVALNRVEIAKTAYSGRAKASMYPFHPDFYRMESLDVSAPRTLSAADRLLDGLGLTEKDQNGYRMQSGQPVTLRLLVNSENSPRNSAATLVSQQLAQAGIRVELVSGSFEQYEAYLQNGQFDLYIGETRLLDNFDFRPLLAGGTLGYSAPYSEDLNQRVDEYRKTGEIKPLCDMFLAQSPFIPLVYREGTLFVGRGFGAAMEPTEQDLFYNILDW